MANVNSETTVTLTGEDKDILIAAIKKCEEIAFDCNCEDMYTSADDIFANIYENYKDGELPTIIYIG